MTDHEPFRGDIPLYLTGDLAPEEIERLEAHLAVCADCRKIVVESQATLDLLERAAAEEGSPADLGGFFDERIAPHVRPRAGRNLLRIAALLLAFVLGVVADRALSPSPPRPPPIADTPATPENRRTRVYNATASTSNGLARSLKALRALSGPESE